MEKLKIELGEKSVPEMFMTNVKQVEGQLLKNETIG